VSWTLLRVILRAEKLSFLPKSVCYFYYLILDRKVFEAGQKEKESKGIMTDAIKFMGSYQEI
jgi:hypothetical protein